MGIQLGRIRIDDSVILVPMSGVSDKPFRALVRELGVDHDSRKIKWLLCDLYDAGEERQAA